MEIRNYQSQGEESVESAERVTLTWWRFERKCIIFNYRIGLFHKHNHISLIIESLSSWHSLQKLSENNK